MERRALDRRRWCTPHLCAVLLEAVPTAGGLGGSLGGGGDGNGHGTRYGAAERTARTHAVCPPGASSPAPQARVRPIHAPHMHVTDGLWLYMSAWLLTGAKGEAHQHVELREVLPNEGEGAVVVGQVLVAARLTWLGLGLGVEAGLELGLGV